MSRRQDRRKVIVPAVIAVTVFFGLGLSAVQGDRPQTGGGASNPAENLATYDERLLHQRFQQSVVLLQHGEFDYAVQGFHEVLTIAPDLPEAHVNMGFALLGLEQYEAARSFFDAASNIRPEQSNAYYGLAVALEGLGDLQQAMVTMRAFIHITDEDDLYRRRAEAAIWEWEAALGERDND